MKTCAHLIQPFYFPKLTVLSYLTSELINCEI